MSNHVSSRYRKRIGPAFAAASLLVVLACSGESDTASEKPGSGGSSASGGSSSGGTSSGGSAASVSGGNGGIIGNGGSAASGGDAGAGCDKIDFLFVVDNSVSMNDEQDLLVQAFPGFITAIETTVKPGADYRILVADTDAWGRCNTANPWSGATPNHNTCNSYIKNTVFEECDRVRGAGVIHPAGVAASNMKCPVPAGRRYLQTGDPNLSSTFACMAKVGTAGHASERPMEAIVNALSPTLNAAGGCNESFLRDDAILVITFISDDPNYEDTGDAQSWYDAVVAAKQGDADAVSVVGFTPAFDGCGGNGTPKGSHWAEFVNKFKYNVHASVCEGDYANIFQQAISVIAESCENFVPPPQ